MSRITDDDLAALRKRKPAAPRESEAGFQKAVLTLARVHGWKVAHFRPALRRDGTWSTPVAGDGAGFPDLVLVRDRVLFRELKADKGVLSMLQREWGKNLIAAGADYEVWRPRDWFGVERTLKQ